MKITGILLFLIVLSMCSTGQNSPGTDLRAQREMMVAQQIQARGITDSDVLDAMRKVERHLFVPPQQASQAYGDHPLPIGHGQTISQPYIVAFMTEALDVKRDTKVLEIGTGSGYQAAILGELCDSVFTIEIVKPLGDKSKSILNSLGYRNVYVKTGDGYKGWPEYAPFDAIIVTCSPSHVPQPLIEQLAEGGKMIIPVGKTYSQELVLLVKSKGKLKQQAVLPVRFVPMVDERNREY
jgi:protein-L-isoaspartate(D-aspartate) O-methyltransferase